MNGNGSGIVPTVDLATNNNGGYGYAYPVMPMMYGGYGYGNNGGFGFGGDGIWAIVLIALLFGNNGFGGFGGNGWNNIATTDFVSSEFTQRDVTNGTQSILTALSNGFSNNAQDVCNLRSEVLENRYANQLAECTTQRDILTQTNELNTNLLTTQLNAQAQLDKCCCDLRAEGIENTQRILDAINAQSINSLNQKIDDLARENVSLRDVISDRAQTDTIINRLQPYPTPSYIVSSPYQSIYNPFGFGWGNNWNYGNGFFGNTIV